MSVRAAPLRCSLLAVHSSPAAKCSCRLRISTTADFAAASQSKSTPLRSSPPNTQARSPAIQSRHRHTQAAPRYQQPRCLLLPAYYGPPVFSLVWREKRPRNSAAAHCPAVTWPTCPAGRRLRGCPLPRSDMADLPSRPPLALQARLPRKPACPASAVQTDMPIALTTRLSASAAAWPCAREVPPFNDWPGSQPRPVQ